jgi:hypothetical protein
VERERERERDRRASFFLSVTLVLTYLKVCTWEDGMV